MSSNFFFIALQTSLPDTDSCWSFHSWIALVSWDSLYFVFPVLEAVVFLGCLLAYGLKKSFWFSRLYSFLLVRTKWWLTCGTGNQKSNLFLVLKKINLGCLGGPVGWVSDSWFHFRLWAPSPGIARGQLCAQCGVCLSLSLPLLPVPNTCVLSESLSNLWKKINLLNLAMYNV